MIQGMDSNYSRSRLFVWEVYFEYIFSDMNHFLFGGVRGITNSISSDLLNSHNTFIDLWVRFGVVAPLIFILFLIYYLLSGGILVRAIVVSFSIFIMFDDYTLFPLFWSVLFILIHIGSREREAYSFGGK